MGLPVTLVPSAVSVQFLTPFQNWMHVFREMLLLRSISPKTVPPVLQDIEAPNVLAHHLSNLSGLLPSLTRVGSQSDATVRPDENLVMPALTPDLERHHRHTRNLFLAVWE
tara:strand:- start:702 stop:1034 length:333 start_codon:yes stop_codon:yes gene_type:complete